MTEETRVLDELEEIQQKALESLAAVQDEASLAAWRTANWGAVPVMQAFSRWARFQKLRRRSAAPTGKASLQAALAEKSEQFARALQRKLSAEA